MLIIDKALITENLRDKLVHYVKSSFYNLNAIDKAAEDIVNEAIINCRKSKNYREENENFSYLAAICKNIAIKRYNEQKKELDILVNIDDINDLAAEAEVLDDVIRHMDRDFIEQSLGQLKEVEQKVLYMRYYMDYTFAEICEETSIKLNTVLSHHRRALERLRPTFASYFDCPDPYEEKYIKEGYINSYL